LRLLYYIEIGQLEQLLHPLVRLTLLDSRGDCILSFFGSAGDWREEALGLKEILGWND
jgi:hypothetical protein